jgi:Uma2 family endonuclease
VEILSPATRRADLTLKRSRYEAAGIASYWVMDPDIPSLTGWQLRDGRYVDAAHVEGDEVFEVSTPFAVSLRPGDLLT